MTNEFSSPEGDLEKYFISEYWLIDQYVGDRLFSWGDNQYYQLGVNDNTERFLPVETANSGVDWKQVSCGGYHTLGLKSNGRLWTWGDNSVGQLGLNDTDYRGSPTLIEDQSALKIVSAGLVHSAAVKHNGTLWTWGGNSSGQLGLGDTNNRLVPTLVGSDTNWKTVSASGFHTVAIKYNGTLWSWGRNSSGQLGLGDTINRSSPTQIGSDTDWKFVSSNRLHNLAVKEDGSLWAWGTNRDPDNAPINGLLGLGDVSDTILTPTRIGSDYDWKHVSCGGYHSAAIKANGSLWMWGRNDSGQLGINDTSYRNVPTEVSGENLFQWKKVSCGGFHTIGLKLDGTIYFWGDNTKLQSGRFASASPTDKIIVPTTINNFKNNWKQVSAGFYHSSAVTSGSNPLLYIS